MTNFSQLIQIVCILVILSTEALAIPERQLSQQDYKYVGNTAEGQGNVLNIKDFGAIAGDQIHNVTNKQAINAALRAAGSGDTVLIPDGTFYTVGGIIGSNLEYITIRFDGTLFAVFDLLNWPFQTTQNHYADFFNIRDSAHVTLTSSQIMGQVNGNGKPWWNADILGTLPGGDTRPQFFWIQESSDLLVQKLMLINSPMWTLTFHDCARVQARYIDIIVDRKYQKTLKKELAKQRIKQEKSFFTRLFLKTTKSWILQPEDLNTDGIDPIGHDFWIHDCNIHNDDDSIAVKPAQGGFRMGNCSQHMLLENLVLTGFGASIGSVPPSINRNCVNNITFFNISMPNTGKGIYIKSNPSCGPGQTSQISNIKYENVRITDPVWWPIWIGPQQQHQPHEQLGQKCALDYPISRRCPTQGCVDFFNITLKNVLVQNSLLSPGVILGNSTNPMQNVVFDNVVVQKSGRIPFFSQQWPFKGTYQCENIQGISINSSPVPPCFQKSVAQEN